MKRTERALTPRKLDELRLIALGRIPRCLHCPRYEALARIQCIGVAPGDGLPGVPDACTYQVCAPMAERFVRVETASPVMPREAAPLSPRC